jgi:phage terminase large subunit-like protein
VATATKEAPTRYGCEVPRIWTPPLRELTGRIDPETGEPVEPITTLGYMAIHFAIEVLGLRPFPWQRWLLIHALEIVGDYEGDWTFRFRNVVVLVARQNGKSTLGQILSLFFLYILSVPLILGTAQDLDTAEEVWEGALDIIEGNDDLAALADKPIKVNGKKTIRLLTGERYKVKAASRRAGRGLSGDLILLDELREHTSWEAWGAITKTTMARANAMVWALSNAGDAASIVLRYLRKMAHKALGDPDGINANDDPALLLDPTLDEDAAIEPDDSLGIFEWSAPPGCELDDPDGWAQANPSMGYGITERAIRSSQRTDPEWTFRTEVLCQWSDGTLEGPFPAGTWEAGVDAPCKGTSDCPACVAGRHEPGYEGSTIAEGSAIGFCVDVSWDRSYAHIAAAGLRADGLPHVEIIATRAGTEWVKAWFSDPEMGAQRRKRPVLIQPTAPAGALSEELRSIKVDVRDWKGTELGQSCGRFYDLVVQNELRHLSQPLLDVAAAVATTRPLPGDSWAWDRRKSPLDIAPLVAATGAVWLVSPRPNEEKNSQVHAPPTAEQIAAWEKEAEEVLSL